MLGEEKFHPLDTKYDIYHHYRHFVSGSIKKKKVWRNNEYFYIWKIGGEIPVSAAQHWLLLTSPPHLALACCTHVIHSSNRAQVYLVAQQPWRLHEELPGDQSDHK